MQSWRQSWPEKQLQTILKTTTEKKKMNKDEEEEDDEDDDDEDDDENADQDEREDNDDSAGKIRLRDQEQEQEREQSEDNKDEEGKVKDKERNRDRDNDEDEDKDEDSSSDDCNHMNHNDAGDGEDDLRATRHVVTKAKLDQRACNQLRTIRQREEEWIREKEHLELPDKRRPSWKKVTQNDTSITGALVKTCIEHFNSVTQLILDHLEIEPTSCSPEWYITPCRNRVKMMKWMVKKRMRFNPCWFWCEFTRDRKYNVEGMIEIIRRFLQWKLSKGEHTDLMQLIKSDDMMNPCRAVAIRYVLDRCSLTESEGKVLMRTSSTTSSRCAFCQQRRWELFSGKCAHLFCFECLETSFRICLESLRCPKKCIKRIHLHELCFDSTFYEPHPDDDWEAKCPICSDYFNRPLIARCGHSFCSNCILAKTSSSVVARCTICKSEVYAGELIRNLTLERIAEAQFKELLERCQAIVG